MNRFYVILDLLPRLKDLAEEYRNEAEHQDGAEYWDQFPDIDAVLADLGLYLTARTDVEDKRWRVLCSGPYTPTDQPSEEIFVTAKTAAAAKRAFRRDHPHHAVILVERS